MICYKDKISKVNAGICENCVSERKCLNWCLQHIIWGRKDELEPLFAHEYNGDVSEEPQIVENLKTKISEDKEVIRSLSEKVVNLQDIISKTER